ncbi:MAG: hypothetical protein HPY59_07410 [Anaerolineae bacterium]|nr:hypothetical protein [Anaerolineae bacterium]
MVIEYEDRYRIELEGRLTSHLELLAATENVLMHLENEDDGGLIALGYSVERIARIKALDGEGGKTFCKTVAKGLSVDIAKIREVMDDIRQ